MNGDSCLSHAEKFRSAIRELKTAKPDNLLDMLRNATLEAKLGLALQAREGEFYDNQNKPLYGQDKEFFMAWLSWVQSAHPTALQWWYWVQRLSDNKLQKLAGGSKELETELLRLRSMERDDYVLELWESMAEGKPNYGGQITVKERLTHWSYYQTYFFQWFLQRFNIPAALSVFEGRCITACYFPTIAILIITGVAIKWMFFPESWQAWRWCLLGIIIVLLPAFLWRKALRRYIFQAMIPRLAVTTAIGYLFLFSAGSLVKYVFSPDLPWQVQLLICPTVIGLVWYYLAQNILRQVKPQLRYRRSVFNHSGFLMMLAAIYSAIGLHVCAPIFLSGSFLDSSTAVQPKPLALLVLASLALAIGVALQLVWEDKPVTEPL